MRATGAKQQKYAAMEDCHVRIALPETRKRAVILPFLYQLSRPNQIYSKFIQSAWSGDNN